MLVELCGVKKNYGNFGLDCSLEVQEGCVTGLIGENGSGKTTTFKSILNLIKTEAGNVSLFGKDVGSLSSEDKEKIGVVLSDSSFSGYLTVKQIIPVMEKLYHNFHKEEFVSRCERFAIPMDKKLKEFSTGMKAKFKVLLAMSYGAKLLILDEPTSGLDVIAREEILNLFREFMEEEGHGILISSHISTDLEGLCDDLYMIDHGKIVMHEETDRILDSYGLIKTDTETFGKLDKSHIIRMRKEAFGYSCLTDEKAYYQENYPGIVVEKGSIDEVISMIVKGEKL